MFIRVVGCVGALCVAGSAFGQTFPFLTKHVYLGGPGNPGAPIDVINGILYQDPDGSNFPPTPSLIADFPTVELDSYVAIDSIGPSTPNYGAQAPSAAPTLDFTGTQVSGDWLNDPGVPSSINPFPGEHSVFIGRLSVEVGASLFIPQIAAEVTSEQFGDQLIFGEPTIIDLRGMPDAQALGGDRGGGSAYDFRVLLSGGGFPDSVFGASRGQVLQLDIYDFYIVAVPGPASAGLLVLAGLGVARRRRN